MTEATGTSPSPAPRPAPGPRAVAVVVRELREETSMSARVDHLLLTAEHDGREARYFVMADEHLRTDVPRLLALR